MIEWAELKKINRLVPTNPTPLRCVSPLLSVTCTARFLHEPAPLHCVRRPLSPWPAVARSSPLRAPLAPSMADSGALTHPAVPSSTSAVPLTPPWRPSSPRRPPPPGAPNIRRSSGPLSHTSKIHGSTSEIWRGCVVGSRRLSPSRA
jgi:hypothetical protein